MLTGLALYVRHLMSAEHGSPKTLAKKFADHGASWVAIGGPWHDNKGQRTINKPSTVLRYAEAFLSRELVPFVWGYPWQGSIERFADAMNDCGLGFGGVIRPLLDPELGMNPSHATKGPKKEKANAAARELVNAIHERFGPGHCGLSTFGSGVRMGWFPLNAFVGTLRDLYPGSAFVGGQTYTEDGRIDASIADFTEAIEEHGGGLGTIQLVPNFGTYQRKAKGYRPKTARELDAHFVEFIDEGEPVHALIGWAENFMTPELWKSFARMADRMKRGATTLPK